MVSDISAGASSLIKVMAATVLLRCRTEKGGVCLKREPERASKRARPHRRKRLSANLAIRGRQTLVKSPSISAFPSRRRVGISPCIPESQAQRFPRIATFPPEARSGTCNQEEAASHAVQLDTCRTDKCEAGLEDLNWDCDVDVLGGAVGHTTARLPFCQHKLPGSTIHIFVHQRGNTTSMTYYETVF
eukprot:927962-Rhodomonas_salina.3